MLDDSRHRVSRRAALKLGATAGMVAASAPYLSRLGDGRRVRRSLRRHERVQRDSELAGAADRHAFAVGRERSAASLGAVVRHDGAKADRAPHRVTEHGHRLRGALPRHPSFETSGEYIDIAYNWLIDPHGRIYEGRWAQNYAAGATHNGEKNSARTSAVRTRSITTRARSGLRCSARTTRCRRPHRWSKRS